MWTSERHTQGQFTHIPPRTTRITDGKLQYHDKKLEYRCFRFFFKRNRGVLFSYRCRYLRYLSKNFGLDFWLARNSGAQKPSNFALTDAPRHHMPIRMGSNAQISSENGMGSEIKYPHHIFMPLLTFSGRQAFGKAQKWQYYCKIAFYLAAQGPKTPKIIALTGLNCFTDMD